MKDLTNRQSEVLGWIVSFIDHWQYPPTIREIGDAFKIASLRGVTVHLDALDRKGYIRRDSGVVRGLKVLKRPLTNIMDKKTIKLKVTTDGTPRGTRVIDEETGRELDQVLSVEYVLNASQAGVAVIKILGVPWQFAQESP